MTPMAPHITSFLQKRLPLERQASNHTCDTYAYAFQLFFGFASQQLGVPPSRLNLEDMDAPMVLDFLDHLETDRHNSPTTRNARLAAIKSFMNYVQYQVPSSLEQVRRIVAIPSKKCHSRLVNYFTAEEMQAILDVPDPRSRDGIRDRAMVYLAFAAGLRVSELVGLTVDDVSLQPSPTIRVRGKGRRERQLPLWKEATMAIRAWMAIRGPAAVPEIFLNARRQPLTRSGFEYVLSKHAIKAANKRPSLLKKRVSPHVLRHTCAMTVLQATNDLRKVSLWLGHASIQTTEVYLRADPTEKLAAIESMVPPPLRRGRFRPPDRLIASLRNGRPLCGVDKAGSRP
jgi:site-specific recombinase XerD